MEIALGKIKLRQVNNLLSVLVIGISVYIILTPFFPQFQFWYKKTLGSKPPLVAANDASKPNRPVEVIPKENTLVIPRLLMQEQIFEGPNVGVLRKGIWRRPSTDAPDRGGNTVIVGHRFTYSDPSGPFYHLNKVKIGDEIFVYWQEKKYTYRVSNVAVVPATDLEVEETSSTPVLTLYTCTPLWSAKDRLVVQAKLVGVGS